MKTILHYSFMIIALLTFFCGHSQLSRQDSLKRARVERKIERLYIRIAGLERRLERTVERERLKKEIEDLQAMMNDRDKDGIPDYLDQDNNTPFDTEVDRHGKAIQPQAKLPAINGKPQMSIDNITGDPAGGAFGATESPTKPKTAAGIPVDTNESPVQAAGNDSDNDHSNAHATIPQTGNNSTPNSNPQDNSAPVDNAKSIPLSDALIPILSVLLAISLAVLSTQMGKNYFGATTETIYCRIDSIRQNDMTATVIINPNTKDEVRQKRQFDKKFIKTKLTNKELMAGGTFKILIRNSKGKKTFILSKTKYGENGLYIENLKETSDLFDKIGY